MKRIVYQKLVRDRIPDIIESAGKRAVIEHACLRDMRRYLNEKLKEETEEYLQDNSLEEMADILEVLHRLTDCMGVTWNELETVRTDKKRERGGFENGIILVEVIET